MAKYFEEFKGTGDLNRHSHVLIQSFLAAHNFMYTDKSSMAASVEVRVPFMDVELMKMCARMPERYKLNKGITKYILKKAMESYLPKEVIYRKKAPFGVPLRKWIAVDLDLLIENLLSVQRIDERGLFDPKAIRHIIEENRNNRADNSYFIYALLTLELWMQTYIDTPGEEVRI
jgi:asparagine synthase (glutamine-hydrolysing)